MLSHQRLLHGCCPHPATPFVPSGTSLCLPWHSWHHTQELFQIPLPRNIYFQNFITTLALGIEFWHFLPHKRYLLCPFFGGWGRLIPLEDLGSHPPLPFPARYGALFCLLFPHPRIQSCAAWPLFEGHHTPFTHRLKICNFSTLSNPYNYSPSFQKPSIPRCLLNLLSCVLSLVEETQPSWQPSSLFHFCFNLSLSKQNKQQPLFHPQSLKPPWKWPYMHTLPLFLVFSLHKICFF